MRVLDFAKLTKEENLILNQVAQDIRKPFNDCIAKLYKGRENDIDWLFSSVASRNIYFSPMFLNCCYLALVLKLVEIKNLPEKIVVDSKAMKITLENYFLRTGLSISVEYQLSFIKKIKNRIVPLLQWFSNCFYFINQYTKLRNAFKYDYNSSQSITLLDTFILHNSFANGIYNDRYYYNLLDFLSYEERKLIYYLPTFYQIKDYYKIILAMKNAKEQFILKECFLKWRDYWFAFGHFGRMLRLKVHYSYFLDFNITGLIKEEIYHCSCNSSTIIGILNYRFAQRLKEQEINVRLVIDWFENQIVDRGLNAGFRKYYPNTPVVGYVGGPYLDNNIHVIPTIIEEESMVIPQYIEVMGAGMIEQTKEFNQYLNVDVAPALRFQHIWCDGNHYPDHNAFTILVALPIILKDGNDILELLNDVFKKNEIISCRLFIKPHPTNKIDTIKEFFGIEWPKIFEFVSGDFYDCLEKSDLVITNGSSTCMETIAKGIPVIIVGNQSGLTQNPIPTDFKEDIWTLCYTFDELFQAILFYASRNQETIKRHNETGKRIKAKYFEPVTKAGVYKLLRLDERI